MGLVVRAREFVSLSEAVLISSLVTGQLASDRILTLFFCWGPARSTSQCLLKNIYNKNYLFKVKTHTRLDIVKAIKMELIKQA